MFARKIDIKKGTNVIGELLLIVVGINIALWFEGVFEDMRDAETEQQYLAGLVEDLEVDIELLDAVIRDNKRKLEDIGDALPLLKDLGDASPERQSAVIFSPSSYYFFEPSDFTYQSMQESGDFRLLSDAKIKSDLLRLVRRYRMIDTLQTNFLQALDAEYIPLMMQNFDLVNSRVTNASMLEDQLFINFFAYTYQDTQTLVHVYETAREMASTLLEDIRAQLPNSAD
jgi:hypothetical protein